jgi:DNA-directed RNA polymerase specialized sigma24 family protein
MSRDHDLVDDVPVVHGWLTRCARSRAEAEDLTVEVFRRACAGRPGFLHDAPAATALRFHAVLTVLQVRGVL